MAKELKEKTGVPSTDSITKVSISCVVGEKINEMVFTNGKTVKVADLVNAKVGEYITIKAVDNEQVRNDDREEEK